MDTPHRHWTLYSYGRDAHAVDFVDLEAGMGHEAGGALRRHRGSVERKLVHLSDRLCTCRQMHPLARSLDCVASRVGFHLIKAGECRGRSGCL